MRLSADKALKWLPALRRAAVAFSRIDAAPPRRSGGQAGQGAEGTEGGAEAK